MFSTTLLDEKSTLLKNKLNMLAKKLVGGVDSAELVTVQDVVTEANRVLGLFYKTLDKPNFVPPTFYEGDLPDPLVYNKIWEDIIDDLTVIFNELENLETVSIANFNFAATETNRLLARLKNTSSMLGDYILYASSSNKDILFFKDSFNDLSRTDVGISLLNQEECNIDQDQGIVTLPINYDKDSRLISKYAPIINPNSNGTVGNNQQLNAKWNGDPSAILDGDADTWFEYEKIVTTEDSSTKLVLDLTLNLGEQKIVNYVRINPNNFGTKSVVVIDDISTSLDGQTYISIKDDIPMAGYTTEDEDNVFILAPSTSKYAGQAIYSFTPRKTQYVHITLSQAEPYTIETAGGQKLRYAIGIRDIDVRGYVYQAQGELISKPFTTLDPIRKVALDVNQNPTEESSLVTLQYFVSPDDGQTWNEIRPKINTGISGQTNSVPELVDYNGSADNTIDTATPVTSLRLKIAMTRNDNAFVEGVSLLRAEETSTSELHALPTQAPFEIELDHSPVLGTISVVDPIYGSCGDSGKRYHVTGSSIFVPFALSAPMHKVTFPTTPASYGLRPVSASEWMHVFVDGEEYTQSLTPLDTYTANYSTDKQYKLYQIHPSRVGNYIIFGNGQNTVAIPKNAQLSLYFEEERLFPSMTDNHLSRLKFTASGNKDSAKLKRYGVTQKATQKILPLSTVIYLKPNVTDSAKITSALTLIGRLHPRQYLNGIDELTTDDSWSIDLSSGIIYLKTPVPAGTVLTLEYSYQEVEDVAPADWDFANGQQVFSAITINENGWKTNAQKALVLPSTTGLAQHELAHMNIVKDSLTITLSNSITGAEPDETINPFVTEVPFVDGEKELAISKRIVTEMVPPGWVMEDGIMYFELSDNIISDLSYKIVFDDTQHFVHECAVGEWPTNVGDYYVERNPSHPVYKRAFVKISNAGTQYYAYTTLGTKPTEETIGVYKATYLPLGTFKYYTAELSKPDIGAFSVDYTNGRVHAYRPIPAGTWELKADYEWTDYRLTYDIGRAVPSAAYDYDIGSNTIRFKSSEVLDNHQINVNSPRTYYQVNYNYVTSTRESVEELMNYFTPVVKDYALKIITKSRLL